MSDSPSILRLGTRGSLLARSQSQIVADELEKRIPGVKMELVIVKTSGDKITNRPLRDVGGKGLWTKELEQALLANEIDFAVHSFKDVPVTMPLVAQDELVIAAVPEREDARDVLVSSSAKNLASLPAGAKIGTGSLRRRCQIVARRGDLRIEELRGNIDTRLKKLRDGQFDAIILAMAGLRRTGLFDETKMSPLSFDEMLPAAGQGALALQCRRENQKIRDVLSTLHHEATELCVRAERALVAALEGDCHSPIAASATIEGESLHLHAAVGGHNGGLPVVFADASARLSDVNAAVKGVMNSLTHQGVQALLHGTR